MLVLSIGLAGCGALRIAYGQAAPLSYWWLDRYVDFDGRQSPQVRQALDDWYGWQHRQLLPRVLPWMDALAAQAEQADIPPEQICRWWDQVTQWRDEAFVRALPSVVEVTASLRPEQIDRIAARQARVLDEARADFLQPDPEERLEASVDRTVDRLKLLYGPLGPGQRTQVSEWLRTQSPFDAQRWIERREQRQQALLAWIHEARAGRNPEETRRSLQRWWTRAVKPASEEERVYEQALETDNCRFAARFHAGASAAQRRHLKERITGWRADLAAFLPAATAVVAAP